MSKSKVIFFTCYNEYYATGEGLTTFIAMARTAEAAEKLFREKFDDYFCKGLQIAEGLPERLKHHVPMLILERFVHDRCHTLYHSAYHFNKA